MDRRGFLKTSALASLGLAALPELHDLMAPASVAAIGHRRTSTFTYVCIVKANNLGAVQPRMAQYGSGTFSPSGVEGGGGTVLFDNAPPAPKPIIGAGKWTAKRVVNYAPYGGVGPLFAGILDLDVELSREIPSPAVIPFKLRIVCNVGPAGIQTGLHEGIYVSIPGTPYVKGGAAGQLVPQEPEVGLTVFSPGAEAAAYDPAWEQAFRDAHGGRAPTPQDRADRLWSTNYPPQFGRGPTDAEWLAHWNELQEWWAT